MRYILLSFGLFYALWIYYLAVMNLKRVQNTVGLSRSAKIFGYPTLVIGLLLDFTANMTIFTMLFLDLPRETLVTGRLKRYVAGPDGWRKRHAQRMADGLLNDFDPAGRHV